MVPSLTTHQAEIPVITSKVLTVMEVGVGIPYRLWQALFHGLGISVQTGFQMAFHFGVRFIIHGAGILTLL